MEWKSTLMMLIGVSLAAVYLGKESGSQQLVDTFQPILNMGILVWLIFIGFTFAFLFKKLIS